MELAVDACMAIIEKPLPHGAVVRACAGGPVVVKIEASPIETLTWKHIDVRHQRETFPALLVHCEGNPPVTGGLPQQRPVTQSFDVFFNLRLNKWLNKQSRRRWIESPLCLLWRHCNGK